jgi:hypothetical protein
MVIHNAAFADAGLGAQLAAGIGDFAGQPGWLIIGLQDSAALDEFLGIAKDRHAAPVLDRNLS